MPPRDPSVLPRLQQHLKKVSRRLSDRLAEASDGHSGTPEAVAHAREAALRQVIGRFFPQPYHVSKGAIYDTFGARSQSIDCVVCAPNHPFLAGDDGLIETLLVDGVFAALELKSDLRDLPSDFGRGRQSDPEIVRGLKQASSVKSLKRKPRATVSFVGTGSPPSAQLDDYQTRCPTYIVADISAPIEALAKYIADYYVLNDIEPSAQVDVVFVLNNGLILNSKAPDFTITNTAGGWQPHLAVYGPGCDFVTLFYYRLISELGPEMVMTEPVLKRYLERIPRPPPFLAFRTSQ